VGEPQDGDREEQHAPQEGELLDAVDEGMVGAPADLVAEVADLVTDDEVTDVLSASVEQATQDQAGRDGQLGRPGTAAAGRVGLRCRPAGSRRPRW